MDSICIYCGAQSGRRAAYAQGARTLAQLLVARRIRLIFGGGSAGMMGEMATTVLELGGQAIGVVPELFLAYEQPHPDLSQLIITPTLHERKEQMAELADAFVAMPGGIGTVDELLEIWTWAQAGLHAKPLGLLNVAGYFDSLVAFFDQAVAEGFLKPDHRAMLVIENDPERLLDRLHAIVHPQPSPRYQFGKL